MVRTRLLNSGSRGGIGALIYSGLHLLEELVDIHQVVLRSQVGQRKSILMLRHVTMVATAAVVSVAINRNQRRSRHVIG